jgi:hypothetical protein
MLLYGGPGVGDDVGEAFGDPEAAGEGDAEADDGASAAAGRAASTKMVAPQRDAASDLSTALSGPPGVETKGVAVRCQSANSCALGHQTRIKAL